MAVEIRRFQWSDIEGIARLHRIAESVDHQGRLGDAMALRRRWRRLGSAPEGDCLVATAAGRVVGYALHSFVESTRQCLVDGVVHPAWRRRGIGRRLVERVSEEARRLGAKTIDIRASDDQPAATAFCRALGLALVRVWCRMWLEPLRVPPFAFPSGYSYRAYRRREDDAAYVRVVNESMAQQWGAAPVTSENLAHIVSQPCFEPANILFATRGKEIVGVCALRFLERTVGGQPFSVAHLGPIGVLPEQRNLGVGRALLTASLRHCRRRGIQAAELDVDQENAPAIHLYEDCGFETLFRILWYRCEL